MPFGLCAPAFCLRGRSRRAAGLLRGRNDCFAASRDTDCRFGTRFDPGGVRFSDLLRLRANVQQIAHPLVAPVHNKHAHTAPKGKRGGYLCLCTADRSRKGGKVSLRHPTQIGAGTQRHQEADIRSTGTLQRRHRLSRNGHGIVFIIDSDRHIFLPVFCFPVTNARPGTQPHRRHRPLPQQSPVGRDAPSGMLFHN